MANVGSAAAGKTLIGAGNGASPTYASIGTNSGLTAHGVVISQGNGAFQSTNSGTLGQVLTSNGSADPTFQTLAAASSLTPDSGAAVSAVGGTIPTLGYQAGTVQTMRTYNDGAGNFRIADQTWYTQYVVDGSTTPGLKGTFQTIQAALNQAVTDGMSFTNQKVIYIRVGTYTENLTIPGGAILVGETLSVPLGGIITPTHNTIISGNHVFSGNAVCGFKGLLFLQSTSGDIFNGGAAAVVLGYASDCSIFNSGSGQILNSMPSSSSFNFIGCTFSGGGEADQFTGTNMASLVFEECTFNTTCDINADTCLALYLRNCTGINNTVGVGTITTSTSCLIYAQNCFFTTINNYCIQGTGLGGQLNNCNFSGATLAGIHSNNGSWILNNCTANSVPLFTNPENVTITGEIQGNIISTTLTATDLSVTSAMYYIGVTSTASARTLLFPSGSGANAPSAGQIFIVKDQSGAAGTNNITITTGGGTVTFDGATSAVINVNYGSLSFKYDGTNYFIL